MKKSYWQIPLTIAFILLGVIISAQIQTQNRLEANLSIQSSSDLSIIFKNLSEKRLALVQEIAEAETNIQAYRLDYADEAEIINRLNNDLAKVQLLLGTIAVQGPGIEITLTKEAYGYLMYKDIIHIINELWAAGAEAVSINDQRVTLNSNIYYTRVLDTSYYTHNEQLLELPISIKAIGDSATLDKGLTLPGGIIDNLMTYQVIPLIEIKENIIIPAMAQSPTIRYGKIPAKNGH